MPQIADYLLLEDGRVTESRQTWQSTREDGLLGVSGLSGHRCELAGWRTWVGSSGLSVTADCRPDFYAGVQRLSARPHRHQLTLIRSC
jgi:hypothetical protein